MTKIQKQLEEYFSKIAPMMGLDYKIVITPFDCSKLSKQDIILAGFIEKLKIKNFGYQIFYDESVVGQDVCPLNFIIHELCHAQQYEEDILEKINNQYVWGGKIIPKDMDYFSLPYERDARWRASKFRRQYKKELRDIKGPTKIGMFLRKLFGKKSTQHASVSC